MPDLPGRQPGWPSAMPARLAGRGAGMALVAGPPGGRFIRRRCKRNAVEAFQPDFIEMLPFLVAGPLLAGNWPLLLLIGWAALPV